MWASVVTVIILGVLGVIVLIVALLQMTGVFISHRERRRAKGRLEKSQQAFDNREAVLAVERLQEAFWRPIRGKYPTAEDAKTALGAVTLFGQIFPHLDNNEFYIGIQSQLERIQASGGKVSDGVLDGFERLLLNALDEFESDDSEADEDELAVRKNVAQALQAAGKQEKENALEFLQDAIGHCVEVEGALRINAAFQEIFEDYANHKDYKRAEKYAQRAKQNKLSLSDKWDDAITELAETIWAELFYTDESDSQEDEAASEIVSQSLAKARKAAGLQDRHVALDYISESFDYLDRPAPGIFLKILDAFAEVFPECKADPAFQQHRAACEKLAQAELRLSNTTAERAGEFMISFANKALEKDAE